MIPFLLSTAGKTPSTKREGSGQCTGLPAFQTGLHGPSLTSLQLVSSSSPSRRQGRPCGTGCPTKVALWADHQHDSERGGTSKYCKGACPSATSRTAASLGLEL
jgi:hypothetical protein